MVDAVWNDRNGGHGGRDMGFGGGVGKLAERRRRHKRGGMDGRACGGKATGRLHFHTHRPSARARACRQKCRGGGTNRAYGGGGAAGCAGARGLGGSFLLWPLLPASPSRREVVSALDSSISTHCYLDPLGVPCCPPAPCPLPVVFPLAHSLTSAFLPKPCRWGACEGLKRSRRLLFCQRAVEGGVPTEEA